MTQYQLTKRILVGILSFVLSSTPALSADTVEIKGVIQGRSGATMIVKTYDSETLTVMLIATTDVDQVQGVLKVRRKEMSMAALIPGLAVQIEAVRGEHNQLVAKSVKFKGEDLKRAETIQAGLHETSAQTQQNAAEIKKNQEELEKQRAALGPKSKPCSSSRSKWLSSNRRSRKIRPPSTPQLRALAN